MGTSRFTKVAANPRIGSPLASNEIEAVGTSRAGAMYADAQPASTTDKKHIDRCFTDISYRRITFALSGDVKRTARIGVRLERVVRTRYKKHPNSPEIEHPNIPPTNIRYGSGTRLRTMMLIDSDTWQAVKGVLFATCKPPRTPLRKGTKVAREDPIHAHSISHGAGLAPRRSQFRRPRGLRGNAQEARPACPSRPCPRRCSTPFLRCRGAPTDSAW